jgi:hypothetical protein
VEDDEPRAEVHQVVGRRALSWRGLVRALTRNRVVGDASAYVASILVTRSKRESRSRIAWSLHPCGAVDAFSE